MREAIQFFPMFFKHYMWHLQFMFLSRPKYSIGQVFDYNGKIAAIRNIQKSKNDYFLYDVGVGPMLSEEMIQFYIDGIK